MASRCILCNRNMKKKNDTTQWYYKTHNTTYTVHKKCKEYHDSINGIKKGSPKTAPKKQVGGRGKPVFYQYSHSIKRSM